VGCGADLALLNEKGFFHPKREGGSFFRHFTTFHNII
jgi:hypothetical protein